MVKRIVSLGAAIGLILALAISSFAAGEGNVQMGGFVSDVNLSFPFFGHTRVRQAGTELDLGTDGAPISHSFGYNLTGTPGNIIFDIYPLNTQYSLYSANHGEFSNYYTVWDIELDSGQMIADNNSDGTLRGIENPFDTYNAHTYESQSNINLDQYSYVKASKIKAGSYVLEGHIEFAKDSIGSLENWYSMITGVSGQVIVSNTNMKIDIPYADYTFSNIDNKDRINYRIALNIPCSGSYNRLFFQFTGRSNNPIPGLTGFELNTGAINFVDVDSTQSLGVALAGWFSDTISSIKSGFYNLGHLLTANRDDAGEAATGANNDQISEDQQVIEEIETYESTLNSNVTSSISQLQSPEHNYLDLSGTTSTYLQALGVVSFVFGAVFGTLGGHQVVITIPLVLGIVLLLVGRGSLALGRHMDLSVRAARRSKGSGGGS